MAVGEVGTELIACGTVLEVQVVRHQVTDLDVVSRDVVFPSLRAWLSLAFLSLAIRVGHIQSIHYQVEERNEGVLVY
jgi:hypothetical protein